MHQPLHCLLLLFLTIIIYSLPLSSDALQPLNYPSANISTKWTNSPSFQQTITFPDGGIVRAILLRGTSGSAFACGFVCSGSCKSFLFSIFILPYSDGLVADRTYEDPRIVWSANRNRLVLENATLEFSKNGDLLLRDFDAITVWSTDTSGKSVVGMDLNEAGSLVLFDDKNKTVWSSMDYPTDSLVLGQSLKPGQRLTANISVTNSSQGPLYVNIANDGFQAFVGSQLYCQTIVGVLGKSSHVLYNNGSLDIFSGPSKLYCSIPLSLANSIQYMQLDYGGHLRIYEWGPTGWIHLRDLFDYIYNDDCAYPTVCGQYGICSKGQCTCPASVNDSLNYFRPIDQRNLNLGCMAVNAISCRSNKAEQFLSLLDTSYFNYIDTAAVYMNNTNAESCKQACSKNCSCKAALFKYGENASSGNCYLPSELYSLTKNDPGITGYNSSAFIKVQLFPTTNSASGTNSSSLLKNKKVSAGVIVGVSVGSLLAIFLVVCVIALVRIIYNHKEVEDKDEDEDEDDFDKLLGLPTRFTFEDLRIATNDFLRKLGQGGFGSVFEGTLVDGTKIAVKRLDGVGQGKKEFLTEVKTIGSIHHVHLVRLVGFCAEKFYRLLVYEYMPNGSLDKWIFYKDYDTVLDWQTRRKIITHIAKGLSYLHEECRQKIVHLDIKPQNILLDENFNAKVSDFGLAKLIDRDQIEVMTNMRGTPGYLAPEWLTSVITEKIDVFSFGVVVLEIICGRRNLDNSKDEESFHLISLLQQKVAENKLVDMVDCRSMDMQLHIQDVTMIMHLAMWCLQGDCNKRHLMSVVLEVLEGSTNVEVNLDYNFTNPAPISRNVNINFTNPAPISRNVNIVESILQTPWILSGPR